MSTLTGCTEVCRTQLNIKKITKSSKKNHLSVSYTGIHQRIIKSSKCSTRIYKRLSKEKKFCINLKRMEASSNPLLPLSFACNDSPAGKRREMLVLYTLATCKALVSDLPKR